MKIYSGRGYMVALDDFGNGFSNLKLLFQLESKIVKIDRFFIMSVDSDIKKKIFLKKMIDLVHSLNGLVVAEGVETEKEYCACKNIGCDLVQGYFVQRPVLDVEDLLPNYKIPDSINEKWHLTNRNSEIIRENLDKIKPIHEYASIKEIFNYLKTDKKRRIFPVVSCKNEPLGVIKEKDMKMYIYSPYVIDVLAKKFENESSGLKSFISNCPTSDINSSLKQILSVFSGSNGEYHGILNASSIINIVYEKKISEASEQNPLTKLPGNLSIEKYIAETVNLTDSCFAYIYLDFNKFKIFNDQYGFKKGDEVISYFADFLKQSLVNKNIFIGHIGGDDFFRLKCFLKKCANRSLKT